MTHPPRLCSFGAGITAGWTDVFTGHTFMPILGGWYARELLERRLPPVALPTVIHEVTHHTCLNTPVGFALSLIAAESMSDTTDTSKFPLLQARIELFLRCYRPWLEGLALFAEFDVMPGSTDVLSSPAITAATLTNNFTLEGDRYRTDPSPEEAPHDSDPLFRLFSALSHVRGSAFAVGRKRDLLCMPWSPDGYLSGYFATKWFSYASEAMAGKYFRDKDFVLNYLLNYFFCDIDLVNILVRPHDDVDVFGALVAHSDKKTRDLLQDGEVLLARAENLERRLLLLDHTKDPQDRFRVMFDGDDREASEGVLEELNERFSRLPEAATRSALRRRFIYLCSTEVDYRLSESGDLEAWVEDERYLQLGEAREGILSEAVGRRGTVEIYYDPETVHTGIVAWCDILLTLVTNRPIGSGTLADIYQFLDPRSDVLREISTATERMEAYTASAPETVRGFNDFHEAAGQFVDAGLRDLALFWVPEKYRGKVLQYLKTRTFRDFLSDEDVLALASLSLIDSRGGYLEEVVWMDGTRDVSDLCAALRSKFQGFCGGWPLRLRDVEVDGIKEGTRIHSLV